MRCSIRAGAGSYPQALPLGTAITGRSHPLNAAMLGSQQHDALVFRLPASQSKPWMARREMKLHSLAVLCRTPLLNIACRTGYMDVLCLMFAVGMASTRAQAASRLTERPV